MDLNIVIENTNGRENNSSGITQSIMCTQTLADVRNRIYNKNTWILNFV
jgi:hypothetical protein